MSSTKKIFKKETTINEDANGNTTTNTKETCFEVTNEPDYIKLYTSMWCQFYSIPSSYSKLFIELAMRMTYCNTNDLEHSQIVYTGKPISDDIQHKLNWKPDMYQKGLKALVNAGAIKKLSRGVYQINPNFAGKGSWKYNPKTNQGGVKDFVATFDFPNKTVKTKIVWADDGTDTPLNNDYRQGMNVTSKDNTVLTCTTATTVSNNSYEQTTPDIPF